MSQAQSTPAPTKTQGDASAVAGDATAIEKRLAEIGAPCTPGRVPDWN